MPTIGNTPRPGYVYDQETDTWIPIGVGPHTHDYVDKTLIDAKGDLLVGSSADTVSKLSVGNSGESIVADSSTTTGLRYREDYAAGKNACINGAFNIWQRGTTFSNPVADSYSADRFNITYDGTGATRTISRQAFTAGAAPVAGYESEFFFRYARTVAGSGANFDIIRNNIEDVRTFAGETVTVSFWAKADSGTPTIGIAVQQVFGSGGSVAVRTDLGTATLSTSWARYSATGTVPSISGKTIGASNYFSIQLRTPVNTIQTFDFWGVQAEAGSVATAFQTATGTLAGELAACQRYYYLAVSGTDKIVASAYYVSTTQVNMFIPFPTTMRTAPTLVATSGTDYYFIEKTGSNDSFNDLTIYRPTQNAAQMYVNSNVSGVAGYAGNVQTNNASASVAFNSEL